MGWVWVCLVHVMCKHRYYPCAGPALASGTPSRDACAPCGGQCASSAWHGRHSAGTGTGALCRTPTSGGSSARTWVCRRGHSRSRQTRPSRGSRPRAAWPSRAAPDAQTIVPTSALRCVWSSRPPLQHANRHHHIQIMSHTINQSLQTVSSFKSNALHYPFNGITALTLTLFLY